MRKKFSKFFVLSLFLFSSCLVHSASLDAFKKRFQFERVDGNLMLVKDQSLKMNFSIRPYISFVKKLLADEQRLMNEDFDYRASLYRDLYGRDTILSDEDKKQANIIIDSMMELQYLDIETIFNDPNFIEVLKGFESKLGKVFNYIDPTILANPNEARFFYQKNVANQVVDWGLRFAKSRLSSIPLLNTASYAIVKIAELIRERRFYNQNILLHYLENYKAEDLGLSHSEANLIFSSIYESRIQWFAIWESNMAVNNWKSFGAKRFHQRIRTANNSLRQVRDSYDSIGDRVNYSFLYAVEEGRPCYFKSL